VLDKSRAILQDLIDSSAWQNFRAKRQELASTLVGDADNDTAAINQEVIKLQSALDEVQNKLKKNQIKTNAIEKKLL
jgi:ribosomal protein L1